MFLGWMEFYGFACKSNAPELFSSNLKFLGTILIHIFASCT